MNKWGKKVWRLRACLVIVFENCFFFVLKNKENKENTENTFLSHIFFVLKNIENTIIR